MKGFCGECDRRYACDIDPDKCDEWPDPVPMTNADRIRAMSDEELAKMMTLGAGGFDCYVCWKERDRKCDMNCCEERCLEWLGKPVEEG